MAFFEFPHTRSYDSDLGWLIKEYKSLSDLYVSIQSWIAEHTEDYERLKILYETLSETVNQLIAAISDTVDEWDGEKAYLRYSLVLYNGVQYMAIQDVPAGGHQQDQRGARRS